jgi:HK97 gp10 family phage protein
MPSVVLDLSNQTPQAVRDAYFEAARLQMESAMQYVEDSMRTLAPSRTGDLRRRMTHIVRTVGDNTIQGQVGTSAFYGIYVDQGTGIYGPRRSRIYPTRAKAFRFPEPGNASFTLAGRQRKGNAGANARYVFARSIRGTPAQHFVQRAVDGTMDRWQQELAKIPEVAQGLLGRARKVQQIEYRTSL